PANVLCAEAGRAKIADFGIARRDGAATLTAAGTVLGTAAYISPEQARGEPATAASDVYSFGVTLYRMLAGRPPFEPAESLDLVGTQDPVPLSEVRPDAPLPLAGLAMASLARDPADRPPDGAALLEAPGEPAPAAALAARPT